MLKVYVIWNDCPTDFGEKEIRRIYMTRAGARKYVKEQKHNASYENQYLTILPMNVKVE